MYAPINTQVLEFGRNFVASAVKANQLAAEGLQNITRLQLKALEGRVAAADAFWSEAADVRDAEGFKAIWPKGLNLAKETGEKLYASNQEIVALVIKTGEAVGQLARRNIEGASEVFGNPAKIAGAFGG